MKFLDLSVELLEEIGSQLTHSDHASLRTVCKGLDAAMCRLFFSLLLLKHGEEVQSEDGVQMLRALANGGTGWSLHAKTLRIVRGNQAESQDAEQSRNKIDHLLAAALASLRNIRTVVWHADKEGFWAWGQTTICAFLNTLPTLSDLELDVRGMVDLSSLQVRSLRKFSLKSPNWRHVGTSSNVPSRYEQIPQLVAQNRLNSLHLEGPSDWSRVWSVLGTKAHAIKLTEITTNVVTPELFEYLSSYSGIEKLTLQALDAGSRDQSDRLADTFFETVLPRHAETLTELSCAAAFENRFSFGTHNVDVVSLLHRLTQLKMSINAGRVRSSVEPVTGYVGRRKPAKRQTRTVVYVEQADIDAVVELLLQTAATLPALRRLTIGPAQTERNRGMWCGNGIIPHMGTVERAIVNSVKTFRSDVPCSAIVTTSYQGYKLEPLQGQNQEGGSGEDSEMWGYRFVAR